jgi:hypothetical protein
MARRRPGPFAVFVSTTFTSLVVFAAAARHIEAKAKNDMLRKKRELRQLLMVPFVPYQLLRNNSCVLDAIVNSVRAVAPAREVALLLTDEAIAYTMVLIIIMVVVCDFKSDEVKNQRAAGIFDGIRPADAAPHALGGLAGRTPAFAHKMVTAVFGNVNVIHLLSAADTFWPIIGEGEAARPVQNGHPEMADCLLRLLPRAVKCEAAWAVPYDTVLREAAAEMADAQTADDAMRAAGAAALHNPTVEAVTAAAQARRDYVVALLRAEEAKYKAGLPLGQIDVDLATASRLWAHKVFLFCRSSGRGAHFFGANYDLLEMYGTLPEPFYHLCFLPPISYFLFPLDDINAGSVPLTRKNLIRALSDQVRCRTTGRLKWVMRDLLGVYQLKWEVASDNPVWKLPRKYLFNRYVSAKYDDGKIYTGKTCEECENGKYVVEWDNGDKSVLLPKNILKIWDDRNEEEW